MLEHQVIEVVDGGDLSQSKENWIIMPMVYDSWSSANVDVHSRKMTASHCHNEEMELKDASRALIDFAISWTWNTDTNIS